MKIIFYFQRLNLLVLNDIQIVLNAMIYNYFIKH